MLYVCDRCGAWLDPPRVERDEAVCDACGLRTPFVRVPLYQVTGASGTGKSAVAARLPAQLPDHVALGQDVLWRGADDEAEIVAYRRRWLRLAMNVAQGGRPVVLLGTMLPQHYEPLPERAFFPAIHYLALTCERAALAARLRARPGWRGWDDAWLAQMLDFNDWVVANAATTDPPMTLFDTTTATVDATVAAVAAWVRTPRRLDGPPAGG
jgi:predicted kinase